jgi:maltokinase
VTSSVTNPTVIDALTAYISGARWFGGKGRDFEVAEVRRLVMPPLAELPDAPPVRLGLVTMTYDDGSTETYQVPVAYYADPQPGMEHALVGQWTDEELGDVHVYDALQDHNATPLWLHAFHAESASEEVRFHRVEGHELDVDARSALFSGEQSNSTVFFGEDSLMKVFRKVHPGRNPDIEIHEVLTRAGIENVAALYGWVEARASDGWQADLAMLQQFLRTASDGWDLALASVRGLLAELDLGPEEVGGDFASEAFRLGEATATVHDALAEGFNTQQWGADELATLADQMSQRLDAAVAVVPQLAGHAAALRSAYDALRSLSEPVVAQRVHGDLHLGQTLRTVRGWKLVDFEGEPVKPLEERVRPDSAWRDVAGMLRSFDYAAHAVGGGVEGSEEYRERAAARAGEWAARNRTAFLDGYTSARETGRDGEAVLLRAYEVDKAVYEAVYETRNRPTWVAIPVAAIRRLSG